MESGYVSREVSPSRHSQLTVTASNNIDSSGAASNDTTVSYKHDSSLDVVDDVGNQPPPPKPLNCSQYGDIQLVKALDVPPAPAIPAETPKVVEVVRAGSSQEDIVTLQTELAASRNRILVMTLKVI